MALTNGNDGMVMPVAPMYGGGYGGYGNGFFGGDGSWIILFLIAAMFGMGGWGMGGFGGFGGGFEFPWLLASNANNQNATQDGFNQAATAGTLSSIQNSITTGFSNAEVANCNRAMDAMQIAYNNQIASMNQNFANQQALDSRLDSMTLAQQQCCCDAQLQSVETRNVIQSEAAANRAAGTANTQAILDKLCQQELDAERRENAELRSRINMLDLAASQAAQTAQLVADNTAQTQYIVNRVAPYPIPAYPVANPYGYNGYFGGNNGFGFNPFGNVGFGNGSF